MPPVATPVLRIDDFDAFLRRLYVLEVVVLTPVVTVLIILLMWLAALVVRCFNKLMRRQQRQQAVVREAPRANGWYRVVHAFD